MRLCSLFLALLIIVLNMNSQVTSNIIQRVLLIRYGPVMGTGFTIDVDNRHYLITARHIVANIKAYDKIEIYESKRWKPIPVRFIDCGKTSDGHNIDVAVLVPDQQLTPLHPLRASGELIVGQDVFFLGFPYGLSVDGTNVNGTYPLPFVKRALVSAFGFNSPEDVIFLDGINNPGFSGGPIVHDGLNRSGPVISGVISGFRSYDAVMIQQSGNLVTLPINSGIIVATRIAHVLNAIKANPIGFELK